MDNIKEWTSLSVPGHLGGWPMPWLAEEMLDGQHQRADIPVRTRTAYNVSCRKDWKRIAVS